VTGVRESAGWRNRRRRRLPEQLLEHRQQLLGIGMFEEDHAKLGAARRAPVEVARDLHHPRDRRRIAAEGDRVGAVDRHDRHARRRARLRRLPPAASAPRRSRARRHSAARARASMAVSRSMLATIWRMRATLSAKSATMIELRLPVTDPSRLTSGRTASIACAASMLRSRMISVTKLLGLRRGGRRGSATSPRSRPAGCEARRPPAGTATRPLPRKRRQEQLEIFRARQRPLRHHRDLALHRLDR
jgi:hypothetical protein